MNAYHPPVQVISLKPCSERGHVRHRRQPRVRQDRIGFIFPLCRCGRIALIENSPTWMWPPSRSVIAGPSPLYETFTMPMLLALLKISVTTCGPGDELA